MHRTHLAAALTLACAGLLAQPAAAQPAPPQPDPHAGHSMPMAPASGPEAASTADLRAANERMHRAMDMTYTGDADRDFLTGMIAHHQGAIDMAEAELRHGKDPKVRQLARNIIRAQRKEIAQMREWLRQTERRR